mgnify:CR=1 FL=1
MRVKKLVKTTKMPEKNLRVLVNLIQSMKISKMTSTKPLLKSMIINDGRSNKSCWYGLRNNWPSYYQMAKKKKKKN